MLRLPIYLSFNMPTISHLKRTILNRFVSYEILLIYPKMYYNAAHDRCATPKRLIHSEAGIFNLLVASHIRKNSIFEKLP